MHGVWLQSLPGAARLPSLSAINDAHDMQTALDRWKPAVLGHCGGSGGGDPFLQQQTARLSALVEAARVEWNFRASCRARARAARAVRMERYEQADAAAGRKVSTIYPLVKIGLFIFIHPATPRGVTKQYATPRERQPSPCPVYSTLRSYTLCPIW